MKSGIRLCGIGKCDDTWLTCCTLHNILLEVDGLAEKWEDGVKTDWNAMPDDEIDMPNAIRKLLNPSTNRLTDLFGMGHVNDIETNNGSV